MWILWISDVNGETNLNHIHEIYVDKSVDCVDRL